MDCPPKNDAARPLAFKPDWPRVRERWKAFWRMENTDRPLIVVTAPRPNDEPPLPKPESDEARYLDPDTVAAQWLHRFETTWFGGEALPTGGFFMGGYALGCGPEVVFAPNTVWHPVGMQSIHDPIPCRPGPHDPWTRKLEAVVRRLLELAPGRFVVGHACQVMANDLLALLRGSQDFLMDMARDLETCVRRLEEAVEIWCAAFEHFRAVVAPANEGCVWGWPGLWNDEPFMVSQSDMSCMISEAMFARYVLRDLATVAERYGPIWYHLDGPGAKRHAPMLLRQPYFRVLQYTPGAGNPPNGPAHLALYRQVQAAGRGLDLSASLEDTRWLIRRLRPEGVALRTRAGCIEEAEELVAEAPKWAGAETNRDD